MFIQIPSIRMSMHVWLIRNVVFLCQCNNANEHGTRTKQSFEQLNYLAITNVLLCMPSTKFIYETISMENCSLSPLLNIREAEYDQSDAGLTYQIPLRELHASGAFYYPPIGCKQHSDLSNQQTKKFTSLGTRDSSTLHSAKYSYHVELCAASSAVQHIWDTDGPSSST